jgi:hypothetical protein
MAGPRREQFSDVVIATAFVVTAVFVLVPPAKALAGPVSNDVGHPAIRASAFWPVILWCAGWPVAFARAGRAAGARALWALGCLLSLLHTAVAFHVGHRWSHEAAWAHTRQVGGFGDGIYVNYAFALVWLADAVWVCAAFDSYRARPRWLHWLVHGFLAFVVFNAAVVFGSSGARWTFGCGLLVSLAARFAEARRPGTHVSR